MMRLGVRTVHILGHTRFPALLVAFLTVLSVPGVAHAGLTDFIGGFFVDLFQAGFGFFGNLLGSVAADIIQLFFFVIGWILGLLFNLATAFLLWVIGDVALSVPLTKGVFIESAWGFTRDLTNMFFVIILALVGLATTLRIRDYEVSKILPRLLVVALLINFSPVLVGVIVDVANIFTLFFLNASHEALGTIASAGRLAVGFNSIVGGGAQDILPSLVYGVVLSGFYLLAILVYLAIAWVFLFRVIAIWFLVVVSPFAFAAYVLPATRSAWNAWWRQLLQWSFIGVTTSLFLYLGSLLLALSPGEISEAATLPQTLGGADPGGVAGLIQDTFPFVLSLVFMAAGLVAGLRTGAAGGRMSLTLGRTVGLATGRWARGNTLDRFLGSKKGSGWAEKAARANIGVLSAQELGERWRQGGVADKAGVVARTLATPALLGTQWVVRKGGRRAMGYAAQQDKGLDAAISGVNQLYGKDVNKAAAHYGTLGTLDYQNKMAVALHLAKTKGTEGLNKLTEGQLKESIRHLSRYAPGRIEDIVKHMPGLVTDEDVGGIVQEAFVSDGAKKDPLTGRYADRDVQTIFELEGITGAEELVRKAAYKKAVGAMSAADLDNADRALMDDRDFQAAVARWKPWNFIRKIGEEWGADMIERLQAAAEELDPSLETLAKTNPSFLRAVTTPQGAMFMRDWERKDANGNVVQTLGNREHINDFVRRVRPRGALQGALTPQEQSLLRPIINARVNEGEDPTEAEDAVRRDFEHNYRNQIYDRLNKPEEGSFIEYLATTKHGGDEDAAEAERSRSIYETLRSEKELPPLRRTTDEQKERFVSLFEGRTELPKTATNQAFRQLNGALHVAHARIKELDQETVSMAHKLRQRERAGADPAELGELSRELTDLVSELTGAEDKRNVILDTKERMAAEMLRDTRP